MSYGDTPPPIFPEPGFYYHYKHDPSGEFNNYAYEVVNGAHYTEENLSNDDAWLVVYRPLYDAFVYRAGKLFDARPARMFFEEIEKDGKRFTRFSRITDSALIERLKEKRKEMYED